MGYVIVLKMGQLLIDIALTAYPTFWRNLVVVILDVDPRGLLDLVVVIRVNGGVFFVKNVHPQNSRKIKFPNSYLRIGSYVTSQFSAHEF